MNEIEMAQEIKRQHKEIRELQRKVRELEDKDRAIPAMKAAGIMRRALEAVEDLGDKDVASIAARGLQGARKWLGEELEEVANA